MSTKIILKKVGFALITLVLSVVITFVLLRRTPGDVWYSQAMNMADTQGITIDEAYRQLTLMYNFNPKEPIYLQFLDYVKGLLHGNLGTSMINHDVTVNQIVAAALPWTLFVATLGLGLSFLFGNWIGVRMAWKRNSLLDPIMTFFSVFSHAVPSFLIALLLLVFFALQLGWFPFTGAYDSTTVDPGFNLDFIIDVLWHACLPILTYVLVLLGSQAIHMKSYSVSVMSEDHVTAARARGLTEKRILKMYVKRIAILPAVTGLAISFGAILGNANLVESLFNYPGMGHFFTTATGQRDYTVLQGLLLFQSVFMILANLIADLLYTKLDPRVRAEE